MIRFKYTDLSVWLREQILTGKFRDGDRIPTEAELSERFSVSRDTVRKAIAVLEQENLVYKVKGSGTYVHVSDSPVISGETTKSRRIGVLMNSVDNYIFPAIVKGINSALDKAGYTAVMQFTNNRISQERSALEDFLNGDFAGLIIEPTKSSLPQLNYDLYQEIANTKPAVLIHAKIPTLPLSAITIGDEEGGFKITEYLLKKGHRNIVIICKLDEQTGTNRYLGFVKAYQKLGIEIRDENIFWYNSEDLLATFTDPLNVRFFAALSTCTAVICQDDMAAQHLKKYLEIHRGFNPDIEICGFDDSGIAKEQGFTSVAHPKEKFGEYAAMRLLEKIKDPSKDVSFDFTPKLVIRDKIEDALRA